ISEIQVKVNSSWVRKYTLGYTSGDNGGRNVLANIAETGRTEAGPSTNAYSTDLEADSSQYWSVADGSQSGLEPTAGLSISLWAKFESLPSNGQFMELVNKSASGSDRQYKLELYNNGGNYNLLMYYSDGTTGSQNSFQTGTISLSTGTWYQFGARVTASTQSIAVYKDGTSQSGTNNQNGNTSINGSGTAAFKIGGTADGYFDGKVDEVLFYSADIGNTAMSNLYSDPSNPSTTNLVSRWAFENSANDSQGSNLLTGSGSPTYSTDVPTFAGASTSVTLPTATFSYASSTAGFTRDTSWVMPVYFASTDCGGPQGDTGARFDDFNGDGWTDIMRGHNTTLNLYLNNRNGSWSTSTPSGMAAFVNGSCIDQNVRAGDVDGDSLADIIAGDSNGDYVRTNTARGSSFVDNGWGDVKINFSNVGGSSFDAGGRLVDVNGDGLLDLVAAYDVGAPDQAAQNGIYLNNGAGWDATTTYAWSLPSGVYFAGTVTGAGTDYGAQFADFNGDGLIDIMQGRETGSTPYVRLYLNDGDGTWTTVIPSFQYPFVDGGGADNKIRIADINVDGLPDLVRTDQGSPVYINQDGGKTFATSTIWSTLPVDFVYSEGDGGARFVDINGDGLVDIVKSNGNFSPGTGANGAYMHGGEKPDLLKRVVTSQGGSMSITYKATPKFTDGASNANPVLPFVLPAVSEIGQNDGFGTIGTTTYAYGGGEYFYGDEFNRKFAGFATTTITDSAGNVTKIFAHQGNGTQSALGEYSDDDSKIGKPYRVDISDGSNNVYKRTLTRWENSSIPNSRDWVKKTRDTILAYDGDGDHKDTAVTYTYDPVNGNMLTKSEYGEVSGSDDGSFSDTGSDKRTATYTYAASSTLYTLGLPQREIITNSASTTIADKKFYYDGLSLGSATKGNLTKEERWISGSSWIDTEKTYDGLGLVVQEKDPRDKATTYVYDSYKLFVATTTDPLSHVTDLYYDLSSGKPTKRVDPNQRSWEWTYDGLDRPISEKIPDHLGTPSNTVL
ncbi:VCBS repeat-containing protein, partial [Candidatus Kaiserbacteria bacterium]|nr:VCBS repeat-containing protein [Candidatus Kaiserbacteria bacterium]